MTKTYQLRRLIFGNATSFAPIMPTFQGLVTEEQLLQLIAYVKSLKKQDPATGLK